MPDTNATVLIKGCEKYILIYTDDRTAEAVEAVYAWAANSELSLTDRNAKVLSGRILEVKGATQ